MKYLYTIGGGDPLIRQIPVLDGGTDILKGALVMKGSTDDTNEPFAVLSTTGTDAIGVIENLVDASETVDSAIGGTAIQLAKVAMNPHNVYLIEYDQADTLAETTATSTVTFTATSLEAALTGGYLFAITGAAAGELQQVVTDASGSCTTKAAFTQTSGSDTFIKILPQFHTVLKLNSTATKIGSDVAAGAVEVCILENYIEADNVPFQRLDPTKHSGLDLTNQHPKFYAEVLFRDHILNPLS